MIFPIGDDQVKGGYFPLFSYGFIVLNVGIFFLQLSVPGNLICEWGSIPEEIVAGKDWGTLLSSMFMHGGWMHLIGNMLFLWIFADNIEATIGNFNFLAFYLLGGLAASAAHIYFSIGDPGLACCAVCQTIDCAGSLPACEGSIPTVGASGAISAVMGAYLVMFPKSRVRMLVVIFFSSFRIPAFLFLGFWIGQQLLSGFASLQPDAVQSSTAWLAHIGGFFSGVLLGLIARLSKRPQRAAPRAQPGDYV